MEFLLNVCELAAALAIAVAFVTGWGWLEANVLPQICPLVDEKPDERVY